jgi:sulfite reductase alpha subunit-like flavoprotein
MGIAEELAAILSDLNEEINISISPLNNLLNEEDPKKIIIICSTTGNSDIPDNALKLWMKIKNRKLDKTYYENMSYLILGLGDTNYSLFCGAAKKISKRLKELSANELEPLVTIDDEVNDYEEKIDIFIELIKKHFL